jgi:hypothetical protein
MLLFECTADLPGEQFHFIFWLKFSILTTSSMKNERKERKALFIQENNNLLPHENVLRCYRLEVVPLQ